MNGKRCFFAFYLFLFLILICQVVPAASFKLKVTAEQANIREKPDILSSLLVQVPQGTILEAEGKEGDWFAVRIKQEEGGMILGYVHESLVSLVEAAPPEEEAPKIVAVPEKKAPPPPPPSPVTRKPLPFFCFWAGGRSAWIGDLNEGAEGLARYLEFLLASRGEGEVGPLQLGIVFGGEIGLPLSSRLFLSVGGEYYSAGNSSSIEYSTGSENTLFMTQPKVQAVPLGISLSLYALPINYGKVGLEYTFATCRYSYRLEEGEIWQEWEGEAKGESFGIQAGVGVDLKLAPHLFLLLEGLYRDTLVKRLEGENHYRESTELISREKGPLYYFLVSAGDDSHPLVFIRETPPSGAGVSEVREAELDLSGISLRIGIKIKF